MTASFAELEARVTALEAERADYRAVLTVVNALGQQTRERFDVIDGKVDSVRREVGSVREELGAKIDDTNQRVRSLEESMAEVKDLLIRALDR